MTDLTAAFRNIYSVLEELYLLFNRVCTTNDLKLFMFCLGKLCVLLFATSCPNYDQMMTRYHLDRLYIDEAHPDACTPKETGAMFIRQTIKVSKVAKIRNRYNQVPHLTQDTNGKVTN